MEDNELPQTEAVFDQPVMDFQGHSWQQAGYQLVDICGTHPAQAIAIPSGSMLLKVQDKYQLVDEVTREIYK